MKSMLLLLCAILITLGQSEKNSNLRSLQGTTVRIKGIEIEAVCNASNDALFPRIYVTTDTQFTVEKEIIAYKIGLTQDNSNKARFRCSERTNNPFVLNCIIVDIQADFDYEITQIENQATQIDTTSNSILIPNKFFELPNQTSGQVVDDNDNTKKSFDISFSHNIINYKIPLQTVVDGSPVDLSSFCKATMANKKLMTCTPTKDKLPAGTYKLSLKNTCINQADFMEIQVNSSSWLMISTMGLLLFGLMI